MPKKRSAPASGGRRQLKRVRKHGRPTPTKVSPSIEAEFQRPGQDKPPGNGPAGQEIALQLSPQLIDSLWKIAEKQGKPYQRVIHELLEQATQKEGRTLE